MKAIPSHGKGFGLFNPLSQEKMLNITNLSNENAKNAILSKTRNTMNLKKLNENGLKNQTAIHLGEKNMYDPGISMAQYQSMIQQNVPAGSNLL